MVMQLDQFRKYYNHTIHPELVRLDRKRMRFIRLLLIAVLLFAAVVVFEIYVRIFVLSLLLMLILGVYMSFVIYRMRKFIREFKPHVVRLVLDFIDDQPLFGELEYKPKGKIPYRRFLSSGIFSLGEAVYEGEDYITGRIGDIEFEMCELLVREFSRVRARLDDVFKGIFIHAVFRHPARGRLLVLPRDEMPLMIDSVRDFVANGGHCMDDHIQDEEFLRRFTVYGTRDARLSTLLPKELRAFILHYRPQNEVYLSIIGQHIFVAISNDKDILEPRVLQSNVSYDLVREFYEDIASGLYVVRAIDVSH
jgi:hypothetical protein